MDQADNVIIHFQKRICLLVFSFTLAASILFAVLQMPAVARGLLLGACFSIINFLLLGRSVPMTLLRSRSSAGLVGLVSILTRFFVLAIPLIVAVKSASFNFVAVVVGIFAVQVIVILEHMVKPLVLGR